MAVSEFRITVLFSFLLFVLAGCATGHTAHSVLGKPALELQAILASGESLCPFGVPALGTSWSGVNVTMISRSGYLALHNDDKKTPVWVCEQLTMNNVHGPLIGRDIWCADPNLCKQQHSDGRPVCNPMQCELGATDHDYRGSGWDRGHLAANMNERLNKDRKRDTFFLSNAAPQVGERFNQSTWQALEFDLTTHVCAVDAMWAITGLLYADDSWANGSASLGKIGSGIEIPTHFWKLVVWEVHDTVDGFAVVMRV